MLIEISIGMPAGSSNLSAQLAGGAIPLAECNAPTAGALPKASCCNQSYHKADGHQQRFLQNK